MGHHTHHPHKPQADLDHFYVITVISNPIRYKRRYELYYKFAAMVQGAGINLITVEQAFGNRPFMVTEKDNPFHVQCRSAEELWLKENMANLGVQRAKQLDSEAREVALVDADCFPMVPPYEWFEETWHALQHYEFVQMWEYLINFGPQEQPIGNAQMSFMAVYEANGYRIEPLGRRHTLPQHSGVNTLGAPGLAWAANISALDAVGGFYDKSILGSGDRHMALGLVGAMEGALMGFEKLPGYYHSLIEWQNRCERWIKRDVGMVRTTVGHWHHGNKKHRHYGSRNKILIENEYNPYTDVKYDAHGLLQLETFEPRQIRLRDEIRGYFRSRNEDSIEI